MTSTAVREDGVQTVACDEQSAGLPPRLHPDDLRQLAVMLTTAVNTALEEQSSLLVSEKTARALCGGVAKSTWDKWDSGDIIPAPVRIGGRVFWERLDLQNWLDWGRPGREKFEVLKRKHIENHKKGSRR